MRIIEMVRNCTRTINNKQESKKCDEVKKNDGIRKYELPISQNGVLKFSAEMGF